MQKKNVDSDIINEIIVQNIPNLKKELKYKLQEGHRTHNRANQKQSLHKTHHNQSFFAEHKEKIYKHAWEKSQKLTEKSQCDLSEKSLPTGRE